MKDPGATLIAEALQFNSTLTKIDLGGNGITDDGAISLAQALSSNVTLTDLRLFGSSIGVKGASAFAQLLLTNTTLSVLWLSSGQRIGDNGAIIISDSLHSNSTLKHLNLGCIYYFILI
uniref:Uncharacterized protein n=1 Tax=Arcella intermedia TaxID=1963864 RepID=A0A6B2LRM0_9EUKA